MKMWQLIWFKWRANEFEEVLLQSKFKYHLSDDYSFWASVKFNESDLALDEIRLSLEKWNLRLVMRFFVSFNGKSYLNVY